MKPATWLRFPRSTWISDRDGIAHARLKSHSPRTICGIIAIDIRYAWPYTERCDACLSMMAL